MMKRKLLVGLSILIIPFLILLFDHYVLKEDIHLSSDYDQSQEWNYIFNHQSEYPVSLLKLSLRNKETISFVYHYPRVHHQNQSLDLKGELQNHQFPLFLQWDERWGYKKYGQEYLAVNGCGPTCLSMVLCYLTGDDRYNPYYISHYSYQKGYLSDEGTSWKLMNEGAKGLGLQVKEVPLDEDIIQNELDLGHPIICSVKHSIFNENGHFIVIKGYHDGRYEVCDPNSRIKSQKSYSLHEFSSSIRNMWSYSL